MRSLPRLAPALSSTPVLTLLAAGLSACASLSGVSPSASNCSGLVPSEWRSGVPSADLPAGQTVGDWVAFGDAQTGQLDKANDRTKSTLSIVEKCEGLFATPKPWWRVW